MFSFICYILNPHSYCFRASIFDNTGALTLTCFSNEAHSMVTQCNKVVSEQGYTDPYTLPAVLTALEGTIHLFQLHFATESTKNNPLYILDTVMETGPHLLIPPAEDAIVNPIDIQTENQVLLLTAPEIDTQTGPTQETIQEVTPVTETQTENQLLATANKPPSTPPTQEIIQASILPNAETNKSMQHATSEFEETKAFVRRQLLMVIDSYSF